MTDHTLQALATFALRVRKAGGRVELRALDDEDPTAVVLELRFEAPRARYGALLPLTLVDAATNPYRALGAFLDIHLRRVTDLTKPTPSPTKEMGR